MAAAAAPCSCSSLPFFVLSFSLLVVGWFYPVVYFVYPLLFISRRCRGDPPTPSYTPPRSHACTPSIIIIQSSLPRYLSIYTKPLPFPPRLTN